MIESGRHRLEAQRISDPDEKITLNAHETITENHREAGAPQRQIQETLVHCPFAEHDGPSTTTNVAG